MCKSINRFFPCLLIFFVIGSFATAYYSAFTGTEFVYWQQAVISELLLLIPAVVYVLAHRIKVTEFLPYRRLRWQDALISLLVGYMLIPVVLFINVLTSLFATNYLQESSYEFTSYPYIAQVVIIALIPALVEEFVFRGLIYHSYRSNGLVGAILFSALCFGIMHMNLNQFFYAFIIGMFFAKMVEVTGSMWSSVCAHFAFNTYSITMVQILKMFGYDPYAIDSADDTLRVALGAFLPGSGQGAVSGNMAGALTGEITDMIQRGLAHMAGSAPDIISGSLTNVVGNVADIVSAVTQIITFGAIAAVFLVLANLLINHMAKKNGRYEYFRHYTAGGLKEMNGERFVTVPYAVTVILSCIYMVVIEVFQHL